MKESRDIESAEKSLFQQERLRAISGGIMDSAGTTFLLLIAVRYLDAGSWAKGIMASGGSLGMLLSPWLVSLASRHQWNPAKASAVLSALGAACFAVAALFPLLVPYVFCCVTGMILLTSSIPLLTQLYQDNYGAARRGQLFSRTFMIRIATAAIFSYLGGIFLAAYPHAYPILLLCFCGAVLFSASRLIRSPGKTMRGRGGSGWAHVFRPVIEDRVFRLTLVSWMVIGFANLMILPLRVEYLASQKYGMMYSTETVALLIGVLPNVARLVLSPIWGRLFDQMNFFRMRIVLNLTMAMGMLTFFMGSSMAGLIAGALIFGVAAAGSDVAWSLWVTKLAPPGEVAEYMAAHTFFTGIRGVLAPLTVFQLIQFWPLEHVVLFGAFMILLGSILLLAEARGDSAAQTPSSSSSETQDSREFIP